MLPFQTARSLGGVTGCVLLLKALLHGASACVRVARYHTCSPKNTITRMYGTYQHSKQQNAHSLAQANLFGTKPSSFFVSTDRRPMSAHEVRKSAGAVRQLYVGGVRFTRPRSVIAFPPCLRNSNRTGYILLKACRIASLCFPPVNTTLPLTKINRTILGDTILYKAWEQLWFVTTELTMRVCQAQPNRNPTSQLPTTFCI